MFTKHVDSLKHFFPISSILILEVYTIIYRGLPTEDSTLQTAVQNLVCFLIITIFLNCKLLSFFARSLNKPLKDYKKNKIYLGILMLYEFQVVFTFLSFVGNAVSISKLPSFIPILKERMLHTELESRYICCPVFSPQIVGGDLLPGAVTV